MRIGKAIDNWMPAVWYLIGLIAGINLALGSETFHMVDVFGCLILGNLMEIRVAIKEGKTNG